MSLKLYDKYYDELMRLFPSANDFMKLPKYKHLQKHFENSISPAHRLKLKKLLLKYKSLLAKQKKAGKYDYFDSVFEFDLDNNIEGMKFPFHLMPIDQFTNFVLDYAETMNGGGLYAFKTDRDWTDFLHKTKEYSVFSDQAIKNMREGMKKKVVIPKFLASDMLGQLNTVLRDKSYENKKVPAKFRKQWDHMVENYYVKPTQRLRNFVEEEYLAACRETIGYSALPNGKAMYKFKLKDETTLKITPEEVHKMGLREVKRILGEMNMVKRDMKFKGNLKEFMNYVSTNQAFKYKTAPEVFKAYKDMQTKIAKTVMPKFFDLPISHNYLIKPVPTFKEAFSPMAYYMPGDVSGKRKGTFYINTREIKQMAKYETEVLSLHEGSPGHHYQLTIMMDSKTIPSFIKLSGYNAYSEGWGLYSEGFLKYNPKDPMPYWGKLNFEMLRSIRLVVDTGMHYFNWSFEKAKQYFSDNSTSTETEIVSELKRYLALIAQANSYVIGKLFMLDMKSKFTGDIKEFHRLILESGPAPLAILEKKLYATGKMKSSGNKVRLVKKKKVSKR